MAAMDDDSWKPDDADYWKDAEWKARDAIRFMNECLREVYRTIPRESLFRIRAKFASDPRMTDWVAMIDEQLERRFGLKGGESTPDSEPDR